MLSLLNVYQANVPMRGRKVRINLERFLTLSQNLVVLAREIENPLKFELIISESGSRS